jgi:hypothetical protein
LDLVYSVVSIIHKDYFLIQKPSKILKFNQAMQYILLNYLVLNSCEALFDYGRKAILPLCSQDTMLIILITFQRHS